MMLHRNAKLGLARATGSCLGDRSSRPPAQSARARPRARGADLRLSAPDGWGPRLVAGATGFAHSTVWKVLRRAGLSRRPRPLREPANSYEWHCPGDLLHMDVSRYACFERPGHAVTGDRSRGSRNWMRPRTRVGYDHAHAIVDDHSRLSFVELDADERATASATGRCHTRSSTTTGADLTARSQTGHRSAAFTTSVGRTANYGEQRPSVRGYANLDSPTRVRRRHGGWCATSRTGGGVVIRSAWRPRASSCPPQMSMLRTFAGQPHQYGRTLVRPAR
jgi:hypothetical protein